jgi:hypothetical protein
MGLFDWPSLQKNSKTLENVLFVSIHVDIFCTNSFNIDLHWFTLCKVQIVDIYNYTVLHGLIYIYTILHLNKI